MCLCLCLPASEGRQHMASGWAPCPPANLLGRAAKAGATKRPLPAPCHAVCVCCGCAHAPLHAPAGGRASGLSGLVLLPQAAHRPGVSGAACDRGSMQRGSGGLGRLGAGAGAAEAPPTGWRSHDASTSTKLQLMRFCFVLPPPVRRYVCSACLSIFCEQLPACTTCGTKFGAGDKK